MQPRIPHILICGCANFGGRPVAMDEGRKDLTHPPAIGPTSHHMDALRRRYWAVQFGVRGKRNTQIEDIVLVQVRSDSCRTMKEKASAIRLATGHIIQTASLELRFFNTEKRDSTDAWLRPSAAAMS